MTTSQLLARPDGQACLGEGEALDSAIWVFENALVVDHRPYTGIASLYGRLGNADRARELLAEHEREVDPIILQGRIDNIHGTRGSIAFGAGDYELAAREWEQQDHVRHGWPDSNLGEAYARSGQLDKAVVQYDGYVTRNQPLRIIWDRWNRQGLR